MHFHSIIYMATPKQEPLPRGSWNLNFGRTSLGHQYYLLSLSDLCLVVEEKIFKRNNTFFTLWLICPRPSTRTPAPRVMKFTILVDPSLASLPYTLFDLCLGVEKKILKEIMHFHLMTYMTTPQYKTACPWVNETYNFGRPFLSHHYSHYSILSLSDLCLVVKKKIF